MNVMHDHEQVHHCQVNKTGSMISMAILKVVKLFCKTNRQQMKKIEFS